MSEYFELFAWKGLAGTIAFSNLTPTEFTKLNLINNLTAQFYNDNCN